MKIIKYVLKTIPSIVASTMLVGCSQAQDVSGLEAVKSGMYEIGKEHSYILFSYNHLSFTHPQLQFRKFTGELYLDVEHPKFSTLKVTIDPSSIDSNVEAFDTHLKSSDFFDVQQYPAITFSSTSVEKISEEQGWIIGDLSIAGISRPVTLDVRLNNAAKHPRTRKDTLGFSASGKLKRSEWGLTLALPSVGDDIELVIEAEFVRGGS